VAVALDAEQEFAAVSRKFGLDLYPIGRLMEKQDGPFVEVV
jgi:hypothetical protein